jgi:hypothetical protein
MTPRRTIAVRQRKRVVLTESPPYLLSVIWESYMTPSRPAMPDYIDAWIEVNSVIICVKSQYTSFLKTAEIQNTNTKSKNNPSWTLSLYLGISPTNFQ